MLNLKLEEKKVHDILNKAAKHGRAGRNKFGMSGEERRDDD